MIESTATHDDLPREELLDIAARIVADRSGSTMWALLGSRDTVHGLCELVADQVEELLTTKRLLETARGIAATARSKLAQVETLYHAELAERIRLQALCARLASENDALRRPPTDAPELVDEVPDSTLVPDPDCAVVELVDVEQSDADTTQPIEVEIGGESGE